MRQFNCFSAKGVATDNWSGWQAKLINIDYGLTSLIKSVFVVLLFSLQGCATSKFDVVIPSIEHNHNWSMDAANYLDYRESFFGPRLSMLISTELKPDIAPPLRMAFLFANGFEDAFQLDVQQIALEIEGKTYSATAVPCKSLGHSQAIGDSRLVVIRKLSRGERWPCVMLSFNAPQPARWEAVTMRILGLTKDNVKIAVPEIRFRKIRKSAGGSFI